MGLFDYLRCSYPLPRPGANDLEYQTKDTNAQYMEHYEIRADGTLWHELYDTEDRSAPTATGLTALLGCATRVNKRWDRDMMTGEIVFTAYPGHDYSDANCFSFSAYFVAGELKHLVDLKTPNAEFSGAARRPPATPG
jgi:hypothetical protein